MLLQWKLSSSFLAAEKYIILCVIWFWVALMDVRSAFDSKVKSTLSSPDNRLKPQKFCVLNSLILNILGRLPAKESEGNVVMDARR